MAPKRKPRRLSERFRCDEVETERFYAHTDDVFRYNWWEVFCFPYIVCSRIWECCVSLCAGTNQCLVYWMMVQWLVCKITRITTPDPIIFPYYFYMFCQVILLTILFALIWHWFGRSVFIPYFVKFYDEFVGETYVPGTSNKTYRMSFRKYCFRKGEIFDTSVDNASNVLSIPPLSILTLVVNVLINDIVQ